MNEKSTIILSKEDLLEKVYALDSIGISKLNSILDTKQSELFALIEEKKWDKIFELLKSKDSPELSQLLSCTTQDIVASSSYDKSSPRITVIGKEDVQNIQSQEVTNLVTTLIDSIKKNAFDITSDQKVDSFLWASNLSQFTIWEVFWGDKNKKMIESLKSIQWLSRENFEVVKSWYARKTSKVINTLSKIPGLWSFIKMATKGVQNYTMMQTKVVDYTKQLNTDLIAVNMTLKEDNKFIAKNYQEAQQQQQHITSKLFLIEQFIDEFSQNCPEWPQREYMLWIVRIKLQQYQQILQQSQLVQQQYVKAQQNNNQLILFADTIQTVNVYALSHQIQLAAILYKQTNIHDGLTDVKKITEDVLLQNAQDQSALTQQLFTDIAEWWVDQQKLQQVIAIVEKDQEKREELFTKMIETITSNTEKNKHIIEKLELLSEKNINQNIALSHVDKILEIKHDK